MHRCRLYLWERSPAAAERAQKEIRRRINRLKRSPYLGRPYDPVDPEDAEQGEGLRELTIRGGYLALYRYREADNTVYIIAFKHGAEARYY